MTTTSKTKSRFNQVLLKIDARSLRKKNQEKYIDCLKPRSNKNELDCKKCCCNEFYVSNYQSSSFVITYKNGSIVKN